MTIQKFQVGDLVHCGPGPNLYKTLPVEWDKTTQYYVDFKKLLSSIELTVLSNPFIGTYINDFGDRNRIAFVKVFWIEMNEIVFIREFDIPYFFSKITG